MLEPEERVTLAAPDCVESSWLMATIWMVLGVGCPAGAVNVPLGVMEPQAPLTEQAEPWTCQTTAWLPVPRTEAVKPCTPSGGNMMLAGKTLTRM